MASHEGHLEVVKFLIASGVSVNEFDNIGWTPLHVAIKNGHLEVVKFLIESGGSVNEANKKLVGIPARIL